MKDLLDYYFLKNGYQKIETTLPELCMYCRPEMQAVNAIQFVFFDERSSAILEEDMDFIYKTGQEFLSKTCKQDIHMITVLVTEEADRNAGYIEGRPNTWIFVPSQKRFLIPEGHREEFYGVRAGIEQVFAQQEEIRKEMTLVSESKEEPDIIAPKRKIPFVTITIVIMNVLLFIVYAFRGEVLYNKLNLNWYDVFGNHEYYRLFTAIFMHADLQHLSSNLIMLYVVMDVIENDIGHVRTFLYYILAGLGGGAASVVYAYMNQELITSIGASGAYFGMAGVLLVLMLLNPSRQRGMIVRFAFMLGYSLYCGFTSIAVDNAAHVGGLVVGLVLSFMIEGIKKLKGRSKG